MIKRIFVLSLLFIIIYTAFPREIGGVNIPEHIKQDEKILHLNGAAVVSKYIFDIYAVGLYLESKSKDLNQIMNSDQSFIIRMHLLRDLESAKLVEGMMNGFRIATGGKEYKIKKEINQLNSVFTEEYLNENDILQFNYKPGIGTRISLNGKQRTLIPGFYFKRSVMGIWLGGDPKLTEARKQLLGL